MPMPFCLRQAVRMSGCSHDIFAMQEIWPSKISTVLRTRRLLAYACKRGLWALSAFLLPVAARGVEGVPGLLSSCAAFADGWSLLHLAVASGSLRMVEVRSSGNTVAESC